MEKQRILISGGAGFIGSHLCNTLAKAGAKVMVLDDLSTGKLSNLDPVLSDLISFERCDITNHQRTNICIQSFKPSIVFHLAALASVPDCEKNPKRAMSINFEASKNLFQVSSNTGSKRFIFASSAAVYGTQKPPLSSKTNGPDPISVYGKSKLSTEKFLLDNQGSSNVPTSVRFFNIFGEKQDPKNPYSGVISILAKKILNKEKFTLFGDGEQTRDFVYIKDLIKLLSLIINNDCPNIIDAGFGQETSLLQIIESFENICNTTLKIHYSDPRDNDILKSFCDSKESYLNKLKISQTPLHTGLKNLLIELRA